MGVKIRDLVAGDHPALREALTSCGAFSDEEIRVALEMIDAGLNGDYTLLTADDDGQARGYACVGRASFTASAWYLYWICVHPSAQKAGIGREIQARVEDRILANGGDRLVLETSGRADYERTRRFYRNSGFTETGRIPGFYGPGDDCIIFWKLLTARDAMP